MNKNILIRCFLPVLLLLSGYSANAQNIILNALNNGNFETGVFAPWVVVNNGTNNWNIGATGAQTGANGAYISNAPPAASYNTGVFQVSHFYIDVFVPAGTATLTFSWKNLGENGFDYLEVFWVDPLTAVTAGAQLVTGKVAGPLVGSAAWNNVTITLPCSPVGATKRLVFSWRNDTSLGSNPPGQIDNVTLINNPVATTPANDLPCNAVFMPFNIYIAGNNSCAGNASEPATPACFTNSGGVSQIQTVWYKFIAPASGCVKIKTSIGTLTNTQIGVYSGGCGALVQIAGACNDDYTPCAGGASYSSSQLQVSALTPGFTYYIMVDGYNGLQGTFSIEIIDGGAACANNFPPIPAQDCALPILVCSNSITVPNPGYNAVGNVCDFGVPIPCTGGTAGCGPCATSCLCAAERASVWYLINITGPGVLEFNIVPNDYTGGAGCCSSDYDFALYQVATGGVAGPSSCANLTSPIRCHYSALGVTGIYSGADGVSPPAYPGYGAAYRRNVPVVAGDAFLLNVSNFSLAPVGFNLNFPAGSPIATSVAPGGTLVWTGSVNTDWFNVNNWGGCSVPTCQTSIVIPSFPANQPLITGQNASCRSVDINLGASLTLNAGWQLMVCNDYTNNGTFTAGANSIVLFTDTCTVCPGGINHNQIIGGNLIGANKFWHVTTSKPAGWSAIAVQDVDMAGNFTVTGGGAFGGNFDATGYYHKVAGNIDVQNTVAPIATYTPATTLEHNGAAAATYRDIGFINSMTMNHTGPGLTLLTNMLMTAAGNLTLNSGKIITGVNRVEVNNRALNAISAGNATSYVENNSPAPINSGLRKYLWNTGGAIGQYEFPVGTAAKGYQRMSWNITAPWAASASMNFCTVTFNNNWPTAGGSNPALGPECAAPNYHTGGAVALDNGVWEVRPNASSTFNSAGTMDVTLYNQNYTNPFLGYTVQYNKSGPITTAANWQLNPFPTGCFGNPPITAVIRRALNIQTVLATFPLTAITYFNTAQTMQPLPVELLNFEVQGMKTEINVQWATASEIDNKGFALERTTTPPNNFEKIAWLDGHGSTSNVNNYRYDDTDVQPGTTYYYRLKQTDFNGNFEYSKIASASLGGEVMGFAFSVIPNPYSGNTSITYTLKESSKVKIEVINTMGQQVAQLYNDNQEAGDYHYEFSAKALGYATGVYTVRVYIDDQTFTKRILETE